MPPRRRPVDESERKELLRRIFDLPEADRLKVFADLRDYLGAELGTPAEVEEEILARGRALDDLQKATEQLRSSGDLASDQAPTVAQYKEAAKDLGLATSAATLTRSFGLWRNAQAAVLGDVLPEGPAARRIRTKRSARKNESIDQLEGLREWLKTNPTDESRAEYEAFAEQSNKEQGRNVYSRSSSITNTLLIGWPEAVAVAKGNTNLVEARVSRLADAISELSDKDLIGPGTAALILGVTAQELQEQSSKPEFPVRVVDLPSLGAWMLGDVRTYAAGHDAPKRKRGLMNKRLLLSKEMAELLGISPDSLRTRMSRGDWKSTPKPDGQIGNAHYWLRINVNRWLKRQESKS
jgi:predicted DNA-binding transcriptional regulator AlpA